MKKRKRGREKDRNVRPACTYFLFENIFKQTIGEDENCTPERRVREA